MKKLVLLCGPFTSRSGYGDHARSIFYPLYDSKRYDIKLWDVRWGDTPKTFLFENSEGVEKIKKCLLPEPNLERQPDIYIDIRIPNEFETFGKFNIGITAGIETNVVSQKWLEGCNRMNLNIVPSNHSKSGFVNSVYDKVRDNPDGSKTKVGELNLQKPMEVLFEGADLNIYKPLKVNEIDKSFLNMINKSINDKHAFLFVGQWGKGGFGEDRKDIFKMIKIFCETFANKTQQPSLILKTSGATFSLIDKKECINKIKQIKNKFPSDWKLPNIYLLHGDLTDEEMNLLYNHPKIKCMVSFTHGEGFGRPLLEASVVGLPIICSNWSGQIDFLNPELCLLVDGKLEAVPKAATWKDIIVPESKWFVIDEHLATSALTYVFDNLNEAKEKAKKLMRINREKYSLKRMGEDLLKIIENNTPSKAKLKLPKLKKISGQETPPKIKLPKLKKI